MNGEFEQINPLIGVLSEPDELHGVLSEPDELHGSLDGPLTRGYSAYEIYLEHGGTMTEDEWLASLKGEKGDEPKIATQRTGSKQTTIYADGKQIGIILDGEEGDPGDDGISPTITVSDITGGHRITITDKEGPHVFDVMDGDPGDPGDPGKDGVSPSVSVTNITGGNKITITDATGDHEFNVMDGVKGDPGYTPAKGTDYWTQQDQAGIVSDVLASQAITQIQSDVTQLSGDLTEITPLGRVSSLDDTSFAKGSSIEAVGIPVYVGDVSEYSAYSITEEGWYVFARVSAPEGTSVTAQTTIVGASGYISTVGVGYVDIAVRFDTTAQSVPVTIEWGLKTDHFTFKASDLAVRNLDYRVTFYIYDIDQYATWTYAMTTDATFVANKQYYTKDGDEYSLATVTVGEAVPANTYYNHSKLTFSGMTPNVTYKLDTVVDCPIDIILPEVADDGHGAWFEIQMRYNATFSCTLIPPTGVKIGTAQTQAQAAGVNTIDLQYTIAGDVKMWTLLNTHSNIPA